MPNPRKSWAVLLTVIAAVVASGCNGTSVRDPGGDCAGDHDAVYCGTDTTAENLILQCRGGRYTKIGRCSEGFECKLAVDNFDMIECERGSAKEFWSVEGVTCFVDEGNGACSADSPTKILQCTRGKWVVPLDCAERQQTCGILNGEITCI